MTQRLAFLASDRPEAQNARERLVRRYGDHTLDMADVVVALGGDGFMLETLHANLDAMIPVFGMNRGSVGFLMNDFGEDDLPARVAAADEAVIHPLQMDAVTVTGERTGGLAFNEVSLLRQTRQSAKLRVSVDGRVRMDELICDGALVATHRAPGRPDAGPDPDQRLSPPALARRPAVSSRRGGLRCA